MQSREKKGRDNDYLPESEAQTETGVIISFCKVGNGDYIDFNLFEEV